MAAHESIDDVLQNRVKIHVAVSSVEISNKFG